MLFSGPETHPPIITVDPQLRGPHELFIGLPTSIVYENANTLRLKLDDDPCFVLMTPDLAAARNGIQDCRWRAVDMTGRTIQFASPELLNNKSAALAYIRAVPVAESRLDKNQPRGVRMVALNDGFSFLWERGVSTEDRLWEEILPYRESPYTALQFCISGADQCNYPTKHGTVLGDGVEDYPRVGDRMYTECVKSFFTHGIDPVASTMKFTRSIGLEYHLALRVEAFAGAPAFDRMFRSPFFDEHPQYRCIDRDGRKIARLSYAFPEVRAHILDILGEMATYRPNGINLIFPRANPYLLYEEPFVQQFRSRHGTDPKRLPEFHPDVRSLRGEIMTGFLTEVRQTIDKAAGTPIELSAIVLSDRESNENFGLDVLRWAREGLVNEISPSAWNGDHQRTDPACEYLKAACRAGRTRLVANMLPRHYKPEQYLAKARQFLNDGAEGLSMWDLNGHHNKAVEWNLLKEVAHRTSDAQQKSARIRSSSRSPRSKALLWIAIRRPGRSDAPRRRRPGRTGLEVSDFALGTVELGRRTAFDPRSPPEPDSAALLDETLDPGVNLLERRARMVITE